MATLWDKVKTWFTQEEHAVVAFLTEEEQAIIALVKPIFGAAETAIIHDLKTFITAVLVTGQGAKTLPDWETAVMNGLKVGGANLLGTVETMGSNAFQALIGLLLTQLESKKN